MKHYIIDTNFIHLDFFLRGTNITVLAVSANNLGYHVYMPQVVYDEMCNQYNEEVEKAVAQQTKYLEQIDRVSAQRNVVPAIQKEKLKGAYPPILKQRCDSLGITVLEYPHISHRDVVQRELQCRKPIKSGTKGYRDTLIWETILEFASILKDDNSVILLSNNTKDFAKDSTQLHPDLIEDCSQRGLVDGKVSLISDFDTFIEKEILPFE